MKDATHTDGERKGFLSSDGVEYFWNAYDLEWFKAKQMTFAYEKFKPIQEQGLISGADAKLAWAKGEDVEFHYADTIWAELPSCAQLSIFDDEEIKFRLKPRTIKLEIEIPATFEPKVGEVFYALAPTAIGGYSEMHITDQKRMDDYAKLGAWRTEEEIKQVVATWRGGIKA